MIDSPLSFVGILWKCRGGDVDFEIRAEGAGKRLIISINFQCAIYCIKLVVVVLEFAGNPFVSWPPTFASISGWHKDIVALSETGQPSFSNQS